MPEPMTASGMNATLQQEGALLTSGHRHRTVGDGLGRIEIRSSSSASQLTEFRNRSIAKALDFENAVRGEFEFPMTTRRDSFLTHAFVGRHAEGERAFLVLARLEIGLIPGVILSLV